jgi:putative ABC transport system permease protein
MIRNYLKIAWRTLQRNRSYSVLNSLGLSLGITCAILIFLILELQWSYNQDNKNADRIYRIVSDFHYQNGEVGHSQGVPLPLGAALRNDFSFLEKVATLQGLNSAQIAVMDANNLPVKKFLERNTIAEPIAFAEAELFDIFDYEWLTPNAAQTLKEPNTVVITEKLAHKYFDNDNPIGKILRIENKINATVTGVLKDIPRNTDLLYEMFISFPTLKSINVHTDSWTNWTSGNLCFVLMAKNQSIKQLKGQFPAFAKKYLPPSEAQNQAFHPQPLNEVHYDATYGGHVNKVFLWAFAMVGLFLIVSACVNFVNMATAQALQRTKEVGVRKVIGGSRKQLFWQFMSETTIITLFSVLVAVIVTYYLTPLVNPLFMGVFEIKFEPSFSFFAFLGVLSLAIVFLSGAYPALVLSGFKPILAVKGTIPARQTSGISMRRSLVVLQFFITQLLIICTIIVASQMDFSKNLDLGFDKKNVLLLPIPKIDGKKMETLRNQLEQIPAVQKVSLNYSPPSFNANYHSEFQYNNQVKQEGKELNIKVGDDNYLATYGIKLIAGRNIQNSDSITEVIVNQEFVRIVGANSTAEVIGKTLTIWDKIVPIVGVTRDFHIYSTRAEIEPICLFSNSQKYTRCAIKLAPHNLAATLLAVEKTWSAIYPEYAYEAEWVDESIALFYIAEDIILRFIRGFAFIAILIGCLGLYGLVSFIAAQKTKEIGIRKVLGASMHDILAIFSKEFIYLILIAFTLAAPLAWWAMSQWLQSYAYRISLGIWVFLLAILMTLFIAALTIAHQAINAAVTNPVKSLKTE